MSDNFVKEMLKIENSIWKKLDNITDIGIIELNDFEKEKKMIEEKVIQYYENDIEATVKHNFRLPFNRYVDTNKCLMFSNLDNESVLIKGDFLEIILHLIKNYKINMQPNTYIISISEEYLNPILLRFNITIEKFIIKLKTARIEILENEEIKTFYKEKKIIKNYELWLFEERENFYSINYDLRIFELSRYLEIQDKLRTKLLIKTLEEKSKEIIELTQNLEKNVEKSKIDYVAILGVFVCVFTLVSVNFNNVIGVVTDKNDFKNFILMEGALIISLACLLSMVRIFIYKDKNNIYKILIFITLFLLIGIYCLLLNNEFLKKF